MTKRGTRVLVLAVAVAAAIIAATAWFVRGRSPDIDVTQLPGAMKRVATVTTEAIPFCGGDLSFLEYLSRGRALPLDPVRKPDPEAGMPPLVSPHALSARARDESQPRQSASPLFFIDESKGSGSGYDRLYADRNADGRFDSEESVGLLTNLPPGAMLPMPAGTRCLVFEPFDLQVSPNEPARRIVARLEVATDGAAKYLLVGEVLRAAKVKLGGVDCNVFLQNRFPGNFDGSAARQLIQYGPADIADFWRNFLWSINGSIYRLSPAPRGETLTVEEYVADAGTIVVRTDGPWQGITVKHIVVGGEGNVFLSAAGPFLKEKGEFRVPAGRYYPADLYLNKGATASVMVLRSPNASESYCRRVRVSRDGRTRLDLAAKPEVTFAKPASGARVRQGGDLQVEALMEWPDWQLCVRTLLSGPKSPEPQVVVKDSSGKVVAQGPMPFG